MAVEDRLGDARLTRDLGGRRAPVARPREDAARGVEHRLAPRLRRQPLRRCLRHAASTAAPGRACSCAGCGCSILRTARIATTAPARQRNAPTRSASWKPVRYVELPETIAPMTAIPSAPPTCRDEFSTAEPTPALSTATALIAAAVSGVIVEPMPMPPIKSPGRIFQKLSCAPSCV